MYELPTVGIVTKEIRDNNGDRVGFTAVSLDEKEKLLSHKSELSTPYVMGSGYNVDLDAIDSFIVPELKKGLKSKKLVIMDEIAKMQAFSESFLDIVKELLDSDTPVLGTIVYKDEPFAHGFKERKDVVLVVVTEENRDSLTETLDIIFTNLKAYMSLTEIQQNKARLLLHEYINKNQLIQARKLFKNAIPYVVRNKVQKLANGFSVEGNTHTHEVVSSGDRCDCDLFLGIGKYAGNPGMCSHIQAVTLHEG